MYKMLTFRLRRRWQGVGRNGHPAYGRGPGKGEPGGHGGHAGDAVVAGGGGGGGQSVAGVRARDQGGCTWPGQSSILHFITGPGSSSGCVGASSSLCQDRDNFLPLLGSASTGAESDTLARVGGVDTRKIVKTIDKTMTSSFTALSSQGSD